MAFFSFLRRAPFALVLVACSSTNVVVGGDGGNDSPVELGSTSDAASEGHAHDAAHGDDAGDAATEAATDADADAGFEHCSRAPSLDADCATTYGTTAPRGYTCGDVFLHPPPCKQLTTHGCQEICANRCCP